MAYIDGTIQKYLDDAAAKLPAPGGGSISALAGALAASMGSMSVRFTLGKKKYRDVEPQMQAALEQFEKCRTRLAELMDEDTLLYEKVMAAYRLPKETEAEKAARREAIQTSSRDAISVPVEIVRNCCQVAKTAAGIVDIANPNLITDAGTAAIIAEAACRAGRLNVDINLAGIDDAQYVSDLSREISKLCAEALEARTVIEGRMNAHLSR